MTHPDALPLPAATDRPLEAPLDVLAIGAHPDDAELFAGGTLALEAKAGRRVGVLALTRGEMATRGTVAGRAEEFAASARTLGLAAHAALGLPDGGLADTLEQRLAVARVLRAWRPRVLLTHAPGDRHPDHDAAHALVRAAAFLANVGGAPVEGARHEVERLWFFVGNPSGAAPHPTVVVDTTSTHALKLAALRCYATQFFGGAGGEADAVPPGDVDAGAAAGGASDGNSTGARGAAASTGRAALEPTWIASEQFWDLIEARALAAGAMAGCRHGEAFLAPAPPRLPLLTWV